MFKLVDGKYVALTPEEIAARDAAALVSIVPASITRGQFKLALLQIGLLDAVDTAIAQASRETQINYADRLTFERNHPLVASMATALGKTESDIDALFTLGATL